jgi:hypothetical protein
LSGARVACANDRARRSYRFVLRRRVDFARVNAAALSVLPALLGRWLPGGRQEGVEYVALNPRRADRSLGSFRINTVSGAWADFALTDARGRDVVSLAAYLGTMGQAEAARALSRVLGLPT